MSDIAVGHLRLKYLELLSEVNRLKSENEELKNKLSKTVCPHAKINWLNCECKIKKDINPKMSTCDGKGTYTVVGNLCLSYEYPCKKSGK